MRQLVRQIAPLLAAAAAFAMPICASAQEAAAPTPVPEPTPAPPQVRVEVRVLEWKLQNSKDFDFAVLFNGEGGTILQSADLTLPSSDPLGSAARIFLSGLDTGSGSIEAVIETLERVGETETLFNTAVIVTVGGEAAALDPTILNDSTKAGEYVGRVQSGTRIPYESVQPFGGVRLASTTQYRDTGVVLACVAKSIKYDEFIQLGIAASVTDLTGFINIGLNNENKPLRVPVLDTRRIENEIIVRDRSIFISGLLKTSRDIERRQGIPWVSELPVLRWLLSNYASDTETTELVFLVRPEILEPAAVVSSE